MNPLQQFLQSSPEIERQIRYVFKNKLLLVLAFTHRSFINENRELTQEHNERLEFLGDSVLGVLVAEYLYRQRADTPEGELSHLRSQLVQASACSRYIDKLGVTQYLLLGKGERMGDGRGRESIHADLFEAIVGAIFLDGGPDAARDFLLTNFGDDFVFLLEEPGRNWKAELQDWAQRTYQLTPIYQVLSESGPDHSKHFSVGVFINDKQIGTGQGLSKKEAQQEAAADALSRVVL